MLEKVRYLNAALYKLFNYSTSIKYFDQHPTNSILFKSDKNGGGFSKYLTIIRSQNRFDQNHITNSIKMRS